MSCPASARTCATITFRAPAGWSAKKASPSTIGGAASGWRIRCCGMRCPGRHAGDDGRPDPRVRVLTRGPGGTGPDAADLLTTLGLIEPSPRLRARRRHAPQPLVRLVFCCDAYRALKCNVVVGLPLEPEVGCAADCSRESPCLVEVDRRRCWRMTLGRNRKFAGSPLEGGGFELPVPGLGRAFFYTAPELGAAKGSGATA